MAGEAAAALLAIQAIQSLLSTFESTLKFGSYLCPIDTPIEKITSIDYFDFIIIGSGTAGSVLANRLSACPSLSVLLLEAGGCPPLEAYFLGYFSLQPRTKYDYNITSVNDGYAFQNVQGGVAGLTMGKMLGGSSSIEHANFVRGSISDFDSWAKAANDSSWSYNDLLPYFKKSEKILDKQILKEFRDYHGTCGPTKAKRQPSLENRGILKSFAELGYVIRSDTNNNNTLGVMEPLNQVDDKFKQSGLLSYIYPVKHRPNLHVLTGASVTKINFDNNVATGVQFSFNGSSYVVHSKKETIVSAGAIKTPQLLMLSGVGPLDHLRSKNIPVVSDLPVGKNLQDHATAPMLFALEHDTSPTPGLNPSEYPAPVTCNYANLDNSSANFAQFQGINLVIAQNSQGLMHLCLNGFQYKESICQNWYDANVDRKILCHAPALLHPLSRGEILLNTTNIDDQPLVKLRYFSNKTDLVELAKFMAHSLNLVNTTYFKSIGAEFIDLGLCPEHKKFSADYWECYALAMSTTLWHFSGTAALGSVVDAKLLVKGVTGLRVVDASIIPKIPGGNINAAILAIAEKIADVILDTYDYSKCCSCLNQKKSNYCVVRNIY